MLQAGALEEVAALAARGLDPLLPAMKAHGVPALIRHLAGEITREEAAEIGRADTRHYAKRQFTWFRHQLPEFEWVKPEAARGGCGRPVRVARLSSCDHPGSRRPRVSQELTGLRPFSHAPSPAEKHSPNARNPAKLTKSR